MISRADPTLTTAALAAAERGWHVFPLRPGDKRPAIQDWEHRATTDAHRVTTCWATAPYNVGIACGPSRLVVVDLDVPKPGTPTVDDGRIALRRIAASARQASPGPTYSVTTRSGGTHLYFTAPDDGMALRNTAGRLAPLIDTRAGGGYVVAAGSTVDGQRYAAHEGRVVDLPPWLLDALRPRDETALTRQPSEVVAEVRHHSRYAAAALHAEVDRVQLAQPGARNHTLNTAAFSLGRLVGTGLLTANDTTAALHAAARTAGLADPEITRTIRSGLRAGIHH